ncbi:MAG TPA: M1 family metallopeptidase [Anaerolineales bacterium]|nr:M1 family metallopeptidase [Anaerolineales bacterium]
MKRLFVSCLSLSLALISCSLFQPTAIPTATPTSPAAVTATVTTPTAASTPASDLFGTPWEDRSVFKDGLVTAQQPVLDRLPAASVYHLEFNIADDIYHVTGSEEVRYTNAEEVALDAVQLRLFPNILGGEMTVSNVQVNGQSVTPKYGLENSLLIVPLPEPLQPGQSVILYMDFAVTVPQTVELNYGVLAYFDDMLTLAHAYPMICVYDDEGWNAEIPPQSGDVTFADASFFLVKVTAPKGLTLVTSGRTVGSDEAGQSQTLDVASGPARDFYLVASPNYKEVSQALGEITIHSYAPKQFEEDAQKALDVAARAIEDFSARYAPFPYTEYDVVATPTLALGIEYPGMIAITSRIYGGEQSSGSGYLEATVAHETGHQWFYNLVGDDQLDDPWLDESLTQFATLQYYTDEYGADGAQGFRSSLEGRWSTVDKAKIPVGLPVAKYSELEYSAIVYGRGPLFFVALRDKMGTEAFDAFLKEYTETLSWGIATPETLQSLAEKHCACDLDNIFDEWVYPHP